MHITVESKTPDESEKLQQILDLIAPTYGDGIRFDYDNDTEIVHVFSGSSPVIHVNVGADSVHTAIYDLLKRVERDL